MPETVASFLIAAKQCRKSGCVRLSGKRQQIESQEQPVVSPFWPKLRLWLIVNFLSSAGFKGVGFKLLSILRITHWYLEIITQNEFFLSVRRSVAGAFLFRSIEKF